ncbi:TPA: hypothetical protein ACIAUH_002314, partial [Salmonella enterica subsp. enterica serovar Enteritidis]
MATDYIILLKKEVMEARAFISQAL